MRRPSADICREFDPSNYSCYYCYWNAKMARRLSYSRHAVDDRDLSTQVNYKMQMNIRRMISEKKHHKRSKRVKDGKQQNHVSFPEFAQNGSAKQFANGTNDIVMTNDTITITTDYHPPPPQPLEPPLTDQDNRKKSKRKHSHSLNKYRRLEIGKNSQLFPLS
uniref:Uncharacterized protein n=1 Tax=Anopheles maculatus TaxID=74869 RepID=A0A182SE15_9DIPT